MITIIQIINSYHRVCISSAYYDDNDILKPCKKTDRHVSQSVRKAKNEPIMHNPPLCSHFQGERATQIPNVENVHCIVSF